VIERDLHGVGRMSSGLWLMSSTASEVPVDAPGVLVKRPDGFCDQETAHD
jgi:hypothetical protein